MTSSSDYNPLGGAPASIPEFRGEAGSRAGEARRTGDQADFASPDTLPDFPPDAALRADDALSAWDVAGTMAIEDVAKAGSAELWSTPTPKPTSSLLLLAGLALGQVLAPRLRRKLDAGQPLLVTLTVPGPAWVGPMETLIGALSGGRIRRHTQAVRPKLTASRDPDREAVDLLAEGRPVVAITPDIGWLAPALTAAADQILAVPPLDAQLVMRAIAAWCGRRPSARIEPMDLDGLDLLDVAAALRPGAKPGACVARLRRASRARVGVPETDDAPRLADLTGYGPAHEWATTLVADIDRVRRGELKAELLEGALLHGIPGTGKTSFARAVAAEARIPFLITSVAAWFSGSSGHLDGVIKAADAFFDQLSVAAKANGTALGFMDELDALPNRSRLSDRGADWWLPVVTHVLLRVEALRRAGVVLLAATNDVSRVDSALLRPGRFDRTFEIAPPDAQARLGILRNHLGPDLGQVDLAPAVRLSQGATGAILAGSVRAARRRAQAEERRLTLNDLLAELAPPDTRPHTEVRAAALHESGHAILAHRLGHTVVQVTTRAGPGHGGLTLVRYGDPTPDRRALERRVVGLLGGRAADAVLGAGPNAGASRDLSEATALLAALHASLGLGGRLSARADQSNAVALLREDPALAGVVEADLRRLEDEAQRRVVADRAAILALAEALLARVVLTGQEVGAIAAAHPMRVRVPAGRRRSTLQPDPEPARRP